MNSTAMLAIFEAVGNALRNLGDELLTIAGSAADEPEAVASTKPTRGRSTKKAADPAPEADEDDEDQDDEDQDDEDQDDEDQDDEDQDDEEPAPKPRGKAKPAAKGKAKQITLEQLQELAAQLLEAGQRKELKAILTGVGAKSLSSADEETYPEIFEALTEAVEELED